MRAPRRPLAASAGGLIFTATECFINARIHSRSQEHVKKFPPGYYVVMAATYTCKVVNNEPICVHTASATTSSLFPTATNVAVDSNIWYNIVLDGDRKNGAIGGTSLNAGGKKGATLLETINSNSDEQKWQFYSIDPRSGDYVLRSKAGTSTSLMGVQYNKTTDETQACMWRANSSTSAENGVI
jgi:hypothetical protein